MSKFKKTDLAAVSRYSIADRKNKVAFDLFGKPHELKSPSVKRLIGSLPRFLKADDFRAVVAKLVDAINGGHRIIIMSGAHTLKVGLSPLFIDFIKLYPGVHFATNGAGLIHDLEIAFFGSTSEDVEENLKDGSFGMVRETAELFGQVLTIADTEKIGLGEAAGKMIKEVAPPYADYSIAYNWYKIGSPYTLHVSIGTDIVCQHPEYDGAKAGAGSFRDFKVFCNSVGEIKNGGVVLNIGSAVTMPEVFLKALSVAKNLDQELTDFTTANFDMIQHYRPSVNVVGRPKGLGAEGYNIIGHHEIMIPLLLAAVKESL